MPTASILLMDSAPPAKLAFLCSTASVLSRIPFARLITQMEFVLNVSPLTSSTQIVDARSRIMAASIKGEFASSAVLPSYSILAPIPVSSRIV